jgi:hypothetical protein
MSKYWIYAAATLAAGLTATSGNTKNLISVASFTQLPSGSAQPRIVMLKNLDTVKTTSVTVKTPVYAPVLDKKGKIIGQKIIRYNSVTTKSTVVTPETRLYSVSGASTAFATPIVDFRFLATPPVQFAPFVSGNQRAYFALNTTTIQAPVAIGIGEYAQSFGASYVSFTRTVPVQLKKRSGLPNGPALANLLTVNFQSATLLAKLGSTSMAFLASTPGDALHFTSDFLNFRSATDYDFSLIFSAPSPGVSIAAINPLLTNVTGQRSFNTTRTYATGGYSASSVPEPADWAMLLTGLGMVGLMARRRKPQLTSAD